MKYIVGIDLGGTKIKAGLVSADDFSILDDTCVDTNVQSGLECVVQIMTDTVHGLLARNQIPKSLVAGVGLGCPGLIESGTGKVLYSNNFNWMNVPIRKMLEDALQLTVFVENDANCAVLGEAHAGGAVGCRNVVLLTLGTGVGSGIIVDGKLLTGTRCGGVAGHMTIVSGGRECTCGRKGCLEAYVSATALIKRTRYVMARHRNSLLWKACGQNMEAADGTTAFMAARQDDPYAKKIIEEYLYYLADGISSLVSIFRPEKILLSGGICNEGDGFLEEVNRIVRQLCFGQGYLEAPATEIARLKNRAGLIGAASLVKYWEEQKQ